MKFGLWLLIAAAVVLWLNHAKRQRLKQRRPPAAKAAHDPAAAGSANDAADRPANQSSSRSSAEQVVACAHCGLHVPRSDAVLTTDGAVYCSESHRRLHPPA